MRPFLFTACCLAVLAVSSPSAHGQDVPEGTLPPVIVRPEEDPSPVTDSPSDLSFEGSEFADGAGNSNILDLELGGSDGFGDQAGILRGRASLFDTPAAASIRTQQEIAERQAPDMFHALQNEVGVLMQSTAAGQASPFVRGLTGQQVLILVDGIRLNNSIFRRGPNQYFNTIDPGMVDHIEVLRGQGSVLWGSDAIGGAINVVTRGPNVHQGMFHDDYSGAEFTQYYNTANSSPYSRLSVEGWAGNTGIFSGGSFQSVRDLDTGFDGFTRQPGTNYQQYSGDIKMNYLLDEDHMLTMSVQHFELEDVPRSDRHPGFPLDRNSPNTFGGARFFDPQQRDLAYLRYQSLDPLGGVFDALTFTASYHRQREVQTRGVPTTRFQETDVETIGLNTVVSKDLQELGKVTTGVDWYYDDVDSPFGGAASGPIVPDDAYYERVGWFVSWDVTITDRLHANAGIRYEHLNTAGTPVIANTPAFVKSSYQDWIGQAGVTYELTPCLNLVCSVSEGFRAPNLDDLMANNPNVLQQGQSVPSLGLLPEKSVNYEVGLKGNFERLRVQSFVYWIDLNDNMVSITAAPNTFATANRDSYIQGVELDGELLLDRGWSVYGNFWYTYGKNLVTSAPLSRIPPVQGILGLRHRDNETGSYFAVYTWMSDRQDRLDTVRDITDERVPIGGTPGFATLNMRYGRTFGECDQHRASVTLENITDQPYQVHGSGVLGTGFTARLGYTWGY
ncbi:MAG: hypothetical protein CMJ64_11390 [Planctomycetaceae bacterium]|nr:hypothetical protein [Planctomycetaceae bacterium]